MVEILVVLTERCSYVLRFSCALSYLHTSNCKVNSRLSGKRARCLPFYVRLKRCEANDLKTRTDEVMERL